MQLGEMVVGASLAVNQAEAGSGNDGSGSADGAVTEGQLWESTCACSLLMQYTAWEFANFWNINSATAEFASTCNHHWPVSWLEICTLLDCSILSPGMLKQCAVETGEANGEPSADNQAEAGSDDSGRSSADGSAVPASAEVEVCPTAHRLTVRQLASGAFQEHPQLKAYNGYTWQRKTLCNRVPRLHGR